MPCLPLRDALVFPHTNLSLFVGRQQSMNAILASMKQNKKIILVTQKDPSENNPALQELYEIGVMGKILQLLKLPDGTLKILVEGESVVKIMALKVEHDYLCVHCNFVLEAIDSRELIEKRSMSTLLLSLFKQYTQLSTKVTNDAFESISNIEFDEHYHHILLHNIASILEISVAEKQKILSAIHLKDQQQLMLNILKSEINLIKMEKKIKKRVKKQVDDSQREYYLIEQMKAIKKELGQDDGITEVSELQIKIDKKNMPKAIKNKLNLELKKLKNMPLISSESAVLRNYIDWVLMMPYKKTKLQYDLQAAKKRLDLDHYALSEAKERVLEYLAVYKRTKQIVGSILCFVGPPGVGKTSLCESMALAMNRKFIRIALGGVRDESEIKGHRRTYVGSMPGCIMQKICQSGYKNPVILLDEIDKIGHDSRSNPYSALLDILDSDQHVYFSDHYLEVEYDLSDVLFIATANSLDMPVPLLDRLDVLRIPGYSESEKTYIAQNYLIPKQFKKHGISLDELHISSDILKVLIQRYTKEAGVRNLNREIAKICRKFVRDDINQKTDGTKENCQLNLQNLEQYNGVAVYSFDLPKHDQIGVVHGLAWTQLGGEILNVEVVLLPGTGKLIKTGSLGEVMQESIQTSLSVVRSRANHLKYDANFLLHHDVHVHFPEGAIPKDGPSAGIAICTALFSVLMNHLVKANVAMTGEINLHGDILPIGGLQEKLLAAHRYGIKSVIIPYHNLKDLNKISDEVKTSFQIHAIKNIEDILDIALYPSSEKSLF